MCYCCSKAGAGFVVDNMMTAETCYISRSFNEDEVAKCWLAVPLNHSDAFVTWQWDS